MDHFSFRPTIYTRSNFNSHMKNVLLFDGVYTYTYIFYLSKQIIKKPIFSKDQRFLLLTSALKNYVMNNFLRWQELWRHSMYKSIGCKMESDRQQKRADMSGWKMISHQKPVFHFSIFSVCSENVCQLTVSACCLRCHDICCVTKHL